MDSTVVVHVSLFWRENAHVIFQNGCSARAIDYGVPDHKVYMVAQLRGELLGK